MTKDEVARAFRTMDAYPENEPPLTSSDRFHFDRAARVLAARVRELEQGCDSCDHQRSFTNYGGIRTAEPRCRLHYRLCMMMGDRCGSWTRKKAQL